MDKKLFETVEEIIHDRRTTKAHAMNGEVIPDEQIKKLLALADRAPNHGHTEPWRFWVMNGATLDKFGQAHSDIYWANTDEDKRRKSKYKKYMRYAENASHVIAVAMHSGTNPNIPEKEERSAVSAAIQNMLLGATALNIASYWSTGGMTYHPEMKTYLGVEDDEKMIGMLYLGYTDAERRKKPRRISLDEKIVWPEQSVPV